MHPALKYAVLIGTALTLTACNTVDGRPTSESPQHGQHDAAAPGLKDGDLKVPANYRDWPVFVADIQKAEASQIRDIYISPLGHQAVEGEAFPDGSISVMEIWKPKLKSEGMAEMDAQGNMIKDELSLIFLMGKSRGAGEKVPERLRNGDWVYAGYQADGVTPGGPDATACRACHTSVADDDWVFRYDEYFAGR